MSQKLLYLLESDWELDMIQRDFFDNQLETIMYSKTNVDKLLEIEIVIDNNVLVTNSLVPYPKLLSIVKTIKPKIIIFLSDECGNRPEYLELANYTSLFLHQYSHPQYTYSKNSRQIPCAYVTGYLTQPVLTVNPKPMNQRTIKSSFIGQFKSDRQYMCSLFERYMDRTFFRNTYNEWKLDKLVVSPKQCYEIYSNSIFVLVGRGNIVLDCSRVYEAIVAGALPVIVTQNEQEIINTFGFNSSGPPLIYINSWENALIYCNNLLNDMTKLQEMQTNMLLWWRQYISGLRETIKNTLEQR
jgi:hypothetical protein